MDSQLATNEMLDAVAWANRRLTRMGLENTACVVHTFNAARLLSAVGRELMVVDDGDGTMRGSVVLLMARFERALRAV
jgi:hypothetical protein